MLLRNAARFAGLTDPLALDALNMYPRGRACDIFHGVVLIVCVHCWGRYLDAMSFCATGNIGPNMRWEEYEEDAVVHPYVSLPRAKACASRVLSDNATDIATVHRQATEIAVFCPRNKFEKLKRVRINEHSQVPQPNHDVESVGDRKFSWTSSFKPT